MNNRGIEESSGKEALESAAKPEASKEAVLERFMALSSEKAKLQGEIQAEAMKQFETDEGGMEKLGTDLLGAGQVEARKDVAKAQEFKIPFTRLFSDPAKLKKFILTNESIKRLTEVEEESERLGKQLDVMRGISGKE